MSFIGQRGSRWATERAKKIVFITFLKYKRKSPQKRGFSFIRGQSVCMILSFGILTPHITFSTGNYMWGKTPPKFTIYKLLLSMRPKRGLDQPSTFRRTESDWLRPYCLTSFHLKFIRKSNLRRLLAQRPESF